MKSNFGEEKLQRWNLIPEKNKFRDESNFKH